jgi:hypothetical protein
VRAAADGTAWFVPPRPGAYRLHYEGSSQAVSVPARRGTRNPGYGDVERITVVRK